MPPFWALLAHRARSPPTSSSFADDTACLLSSSARRRDYRRSQSIARLFPVSLRRVCASSESRHKCLWRNLDPPYHFHALLALLLPFEQLALSGDVPAIAFRQHILPDCSNRLARDHPRSNRRLYRNLELLPRNQFFQFGGHHDAV